MGSDNENTKQDDFKTSKNIIKDKGEQQENINATAGANTGDSNNPVICTKMIGFSLILLFSRRKNRKLKR